MARSTTVKEWFGSRFQELHPQLQQLYLRGGRLYGDANVELGHGMAAVPGWLLAKFMSLPTKRGTHEFMINIKEEGGQLLWSRCFDGEFALRSRFSAFGHFPEGYWLERSGPVELALTVDVVNGGWYWRRRKAWIFGCPVLQLLLPTVTAYKRIECGRYRFYVSFSFPVLGEILSFGGLLDASINEERVSLLRMPA